VESEVELTVGTGVGGKAVLAAEVAYSGGFGEELGGGQRAACSEREQLWCLLSSAVTYLLFEVISPSGELGDFS
jgi:hypothetical protein